LLRRSAARVALVVALVTAAPVLPSATALSVPDAVVTTAALALGTSTRAVERERLVGLTWESGSATVRYRWRTGHGWTPWETAEAEGPGRPGTEPLWRPTGATRVALDVRGAVTGLRLVRVADGTRRSWTAARAHAATTARVLGPVRTRADWGADESIRRGRPAYAPSVRAVVVHHTVQANDYDAADVPALIRADYAYHVRGRGWDDLGYNLLVDRFGGVWEGRRGGLGRATVGTHAAGFNRGTLGVAVLGDYTRTTPSREVVRALARVAGYAAATWRWDPRGTVALTSQGSPRYRAGRTARLPRVFPHRATSTTACPGSLTDVLGTVREGADVLRRPAPQVLSADVSGAPVRAPEPLVVTSRLSARTPWRAQVVDAAGDVVATASGTGTTARLEWDGRRPVPLTLDGTEPLRVPAPPGTYTWTVTADDGWHDPHARSGTVEVGLPLLPPLLTAT
jgi:hypothetical protein